MRASTEYPRTPLQVKRALRRAGLSQREAAHLLNKSEAMVSMALSGVAKSAPVLDGIRRLLRDRQANGDIPPAA